MDKLLRWLEQPANLAIVISLISLCISITTTWVNLRRGKVKMARPRRVLLFPKAIYADLILTSTGSRGRVLEELVLKLTSPDGVSQLREWVHIKKGDKQYSQRTSAFIPYTGYVASHEWYFDKEERLRKYKSGYHVIDIFDVTTLNIFRWNGRRLFSVKFKLADEDVDAINSQLSYSEESTTGFIELDWNSSFLEYEVSYQPPRRLAVGDVPPYSTIESD